MEACDKQRAPLLFWAKLDRERSSPAYHPLCCHLIDVGMVAREIWRSVLPLAARRRIAGVLRVSEDDAERWVAFFAAVHDIGKLSPPFQLQDPSMCSLLEAAGFTFSGRRLPHHSPHGTVTTKTLPAILTAELGLAGDLASRVATVVGGHHGVFPRSGDVDDVSDEGKGRWSEARIALVKAVAEILGVPREGPTGQLDNSAAMVLAGLVSVADWIGSNTAFFAYLVPDLSAWHGIDAHAYPEHAERQAREALDRLGWTAWSPPTDTRSFDRLFPEITPNDMQAEVIRFADGVDGPSIVVVEVPMGEGKTEAAMYLADRWGAALGQRGCYFALPTQATSNQMFSRVRSFLAARYAGDVVDLQLLHGHASLSAEFGELRRDGDRLLRIRDVRGDDGADGASPSVVAAEWFTHRKRGLLAPFGVGTVDQSLLAVLQTRHVFVRLFGLSHKTVVVDEVHAYDAYMSTLLEGLLEWLAALGSSVVLLSATLPRVRREKLIDAYRKGLGSTGAAQLPNVAYPRVTWLDASSSGARQVGVSARSIKTVRLDWIDGGVPDREAGPFVLGECLEAALSGGGCAVVVCNTVRRAQEVYRALKRHFPEKADDGLPVLDLLHARYLFADRDRREKRTLVRFGKEGAEIAFADGDTRRVRRPDKAILVATQIVEQSLDLDFDLMVTDLAPIDLVLQRLGRLYRHDRKRPDGFDGPTLWICRPAAVAGDVPTFDAGTAAVYDGHVLLRSWLALRDRGFLGIPGDVEGLIERVYGEWACPDDASEELRARWEETMRRHLADVDAERSEARDRWLKSPSYRGAFWRFTGDPREEDAPDFHRAHQALTRLAGETVSVVCLFGTSLKPSLDSSGREPISTSDVPSVELTRKLLERTVSISDKRVVFALMAEATPTGWTKSPLLRHHRLLVLDENGEVTVGQYRLRVDPEVGVLVADP